MTVVAGALGIDAGSVRVGLAAADPTGTLASPVAVLARVPPALLWERVRAEAELRGSTHLVVGLPLRLDGAEGEAAADARHLAAEAAAQTGLRVELWDERLSSAQAERQLIAAGRRRRQRRDQLDAVAAALVLQAWLDAHRLRGPEGASGSQRDRGRLGR